MSAKKTEIEIYDTTLRDGAQSRGINFSLEDKVRITKRLDDFGVHFIEAGWPDSNPTDGEYFKRIKKHKIKNARIVAFGRTRAKGRTCAKDATIQALLRAEPDALTIFGKSWDLQAEQVLKVSLKENLKIISDTVKYLKKKGFFVLYDAEHFFDGYISNAGYAVDTIMAAADAGADRIVLCDTNGGSLPSFIAALVCEAVSKTGAVIGVHAHNDSELAVANTLAAVEAGATHVHGTINGYGERAGNANLCSIIPNLMLKMNFKCIPKKNLARLRELARFVCELANVPMPGNLPYVGDYAFTHKAGAHMDAMKKMAHSYEHIKPLLVGGSTGTVVSDVSGRSNVIELAGQLGIDITGDAHKRTVRAVLKELKELGYGGYRFEGAEGSFELLVRKHLGVRKEFFSLEGFRVVVDKRASEKIYSEATIRIEVPDGKEFMVAEGNGPVDALDNALKKALLRFYPSLGEMRLIDYKVRVLDERDGTAASVRVLITSTDGKGVWGTVGVSENVIQASWKALVDSIEYKLLKDGL